jgi:hypothetical protein
MSEMSSAARQLIARTRTGHDPCPADERRVGHALARRIASGAVATGAAASAAKAAGASATIGLGKSIVLVAIGVGATVGLAQVRRAWTAVDPAPAISAGVRDIGARVPADPRALLERTDPAPAVSVDLGTRGASLPATRDETPSPSRDLDPASPTLPQAPPVARFDVVPEPAGSPARSDRLAAETAELRAAQQAMRSGRPADALALLDQQDAFYRAGTLTQERAAARVLALCELGSVAAARAAAQTFEQRWPRSPLLARVRTACDVR